ncbi:MAG: methyltransferase domain-containing protein [Leptolyngbya sp. Prado105]|jgi:SAM-dependent methyltransferase|nr:methyltransferase domain-containing protein [Leptolyngbya sp. Prado105]
MLEEKISHDDRVQREQDFHDQRFADPSIRANKVDRFYRIAHSIKQDYEQFLLASCCNKTVVEYGCGTGSYAFLLAENGAKMVTGIDISPVAIEQAVSEINQQENLNFIVMNAENLEFQPDSIDLICGTGILHHLDLEKAMRSISETLQLKGQAVFIEPLGHNILINTYRRLTPAIRSEDEHPLLKQDLQIFDQYFNKVEIQYFYLTTLAASLFTNLAGFTMLVKGLEFIDRQLFKIPMLRSQAWQVLITLSEPVKDQ